MKHSYWLGFAIAPAVGPILYGIIALFIPEVIQKKEFGLDSWLISTLYFIFISYIATFILGFPLLSALEKLKKLYFIWVVACGSMVYAASLYFVLFQVMGAKIIGNKAGVISTTLLVGLGLGVIVTALFCKLSGITSQPKQTTRRGAVGL